MKKFLVCFLFALTASAVTAQSQHDLNVTVPIGRILEQIEVIKQTEFDFSKIPAILKGLINILLKCPGGKTQMFHTVTEELPPIMKNYLESLTLLSITQQIDTLDINWKNVQVTPPPQGAVDDLVKFMKTPAFVAIHDKIWGNDEFLHLIGFLFKSGCPDIYAFIKKLYIDLEREDLALNIPTQPPSIDVGERSASSVIYASHPFPVAFKAPEIQACDLGDFLSILTPIALSKLHQFLLLLLYTLQEVVGNASMHVLLIHLGEPQMGAFIQELMGMPQMQQFLPIVNGLLLSEESPLAPLNNLIEILTGLTLRNMDLFKYVISALSWLVWGIPFP